MPWVKVDDRARCHPKFFRAGCLAFGYWNAGLGYCNEHLTNGFIASRDLELVFPGMLPADREAAIRSLIREELLHTVSKGGRPACPGPLCRRFTARRDDGYLMHDYLAFQPSKRDVKVMRHGRVQAARKGGVKSGESRRHFASTKREAPNEPPSRPVPSRPKETKQLTTLSGLTPDAPPASHGHRAEARDVLAWLNEKAGKRFEFIDANLGFIESRLREGRPAWLLKKLVSVKAKAWPKGHEMHEYLRPATLFNRTKCAQYIGQIPVGAEALP